MCVCVVYPRTSLRTHATRAQDHRSSTNFHLSLFFFSFFLFWIPFSFFFLFVYFFFFFFRLIISTRFDFVNVGRNPSCEIWRKNPNSRACARRDAHYNFEKCFSKYVSRQINDRSSLTRSIDKIFFLPGLSWTGNKVTLFLKHLCLLFFFALPTFTRARDHGQRYRWGLYWFEKWETTRWKDRKRH